MWGFMRKVMLTAGIVMATSASAYSADVVVIANSFTLDGKELSYAEIEDIFTLRNKRWENGAPIKVYLLPRNDRRTREFTLKYLGMTPNRYYDMIEGKESLGKSNVTNVVETETDVIRKVITTPGSIGYASDIIVINFSGNLTIVK